MSDKTQSEADVTAEQTDQPPTDEQLSTELAAWLHARGARLRACVFTPFDGVPIAVENFTSWPVRVVIEQNK